ncbi:MAG: GTP-binding protein [Anaerolineales bacterium]|nr:GTP-binding protein [Anaerolineales bacterium]
MSALSVQRKVCILGDFGVGKTSLVRRYVEGIFSDEYLSTIGVKISRRVVEVSPEKQVSLIIWDVAGSEEFNGKHTSYLQGASAALLVCDLTRSDTLLTLQKYAQRMKEIEPNSSFVVLANKNDLTDQFEISADEVASFAAGINAPWFFTSAKTGEQVETSFAQLAAVLEGV